MQVAIKGRAAACQRELGSDQPRGDDSDERGLLAIAFILTLTPGEFHTGRVDLTLGRMAPIDTSVKAASKPHCVLFAGGVTSGEFVGVAAWGSAKSAVRSERICQKCGAEREPFVRGVAAGQRGRQSTSAVSLGRRSVGQWSVTEPVCLRPCHVCGRRGPT